jgi:hypothetical protein
MILPYDDPVVYEKHKAQQRLLKEAKQDLKQYSKIVHREAEKIRKKFKGKFKIISTAKSAI